MQVLTVQAFLEPRLDQVKIALLERIAVELQVEAAVVADLEQVCRNHVLKAFGDMDRRTFQDLNAAGSSCRSPGGQHPSSKISSMHRPLPWRCSGVRRPQGPSVISTGISGPGSNGRSRRCALSCRSVPHPSRPPAGGRQSTRKVTAITAVMSLSMVRVS